MANRDYIIPDSYYGYTIPSETGYWTRKRWFTFVVIILLFWVTLYLFTHSPNEFTGYKYSSFSTQQVQEITNILSGNEVKMPEPVAVQPDSCIKMDSTQSGGQDSLQQHTEAVSSIAKVHCDSCAVNEAMIYIRGIYGDNIDDRQMLAIRLFMGSSTPFETGTYLAGTKLKLKSFFWLVGTSLYIEAIFWTLIGVLCGILFSIGADIKYYPGRRYSRYYSSQIPYDIAKFFYAPFCTLVILLCYNFVKHRNIIEVNTSEGMIVFAFFTGLISGRIMGVVQKVKDVVIPERNYNYKSFERGRDTASKPPVIKEVKQESIAFPEETKKSEKEKGHVEIPVPEPVNPKIEKELSGNTEDIKEVKVDLKLDSSGLYEDEKALILKSGFNDAVVTIHNVSGKDIMHLRKAEGKPVFTVHNVKPGIYIIRSTMTQQMSDRFVMNLFGEKTIFITHENHRVELHIKKYEALD